jgi:hypothetical protein
VSDHTVESSWRKGCSPENDLDEVAIREKVEQRCDWTEDRSLAEKSTDLLALT